MVIGKHIKTHKASEVTTYYMVELHYTYSGIKYCIDRYWDGRKHDRLLMPVRNKELAEAVWQELANNDWRC